MRRKMSPEEIRIEIRVLSRVANMLYHEAGRWSDATNTSPLVKRELYAEDCRLAVKVSTMRDKLKAKLSRGERT